MTCSASPLNGDEESIRTPKSCWIDDCLNEKHAVIQLDELEKSFCHNRQGSTVYVLAVRSSEPIPIRSLLIECERRVIQLLHLQTQSCRMMIMTVSLSDQKDSDSVLGTVFSKLRIGNLLVGVSRPLPILDVLVWQEALQQAIDAYHRNVFSKFILTIASEESAVHSMDVFAYGHWVSSLASALRAGGTDEAVRVIRIVADKMGQTAPSLSDVAEWCAQVMVIVAAIFSGYSPDVMGNARLTKHSWIEYVGQQCPKWRNWVDVLCRDVQSISGLLCNDEHQYHSALVRRVLDCIHQNYHENLDVQYLADQVFLSPSYLSKRFKAETGVKLHDYITRTRMEKAKELLAHNLNLKVYEVGVEVGYADPTYFIKLFKREVGVTPKHYRANWKGQSK